MSREQEILARYTTLLAGGHEAEAHQLSLVIVRMMRDGPAGADLRDAQALEVPREVTRVDGCTCSGGTDLHVVGCGVRELTPQEYERRVHEAERRISAFAAGVQAAMSAFR